MKQSTYDSRRNLYCKHFNALRLTKNVFRRNLVITGGILSSSLAIATDAAHLLTDFGSFMISLFALWVGSRPPTRSMPFGWYRAEVMGALTSVLMIWVVTGILFYMAVERILNGAYDIDSKFMLITSVFGLIVNIT